MTQMIANAYFVGRVESTIQLIEFYYGHLSISITAITLKDYVEKVLVANQWKQEDIDYVKELYFKGDEG